MRISEDYLLAAAYKFELENGNDLGQEELSSIQECGLADIDPENVAESIRNYISDKSSPSPSYLGLAVFALGKQCNIRNKALFVELLKELLEKRSVEIYQAMVALSNLNERILEGSSSAIDIERNCLLAEKYLRQVDA